METKPRIEPELVEEFVAKAHGDLERVKTLLAKTPSLINATWDWGAGDFETGLGGASHMGRADIAAYLLENGARIDLFAAAMLGRLEIVKAAIDQEPAQLRVLGPHGIPLIAHAQAGGEPAKQVLDFLSEARARYDAA